MCRTSQFIYDVDPDGRAGVLPRRSPRTHPGHRARDDALPDAELRQAPLIESLEIPRNREMPADPKRLEGIRREIDHIIPIEPDRFTDRPVGRREGVGGLVFKGEEDDHVVHPDWGRRHGEGHRAPRVLHRTRQTGQPKHRSPAVPPRRCTCHDVVGRRARIARRAAVRSTPTASARSATRSRSVVRTESPRVRRRVWSACRSDPRARSGDSSPQRRSASCSRGSSRPSELAKKTSSASGFPARRTGSHRPSGVRRSSEFAPSVQSRNGAERPIGVEVDGTPPISKPPSNSRHRTVNERLRRLRVR